MKQRLDLQGPRVQVEYEKGPFIIGNETSYVHHIRLMWISFNNLTHGLYNP